MLLEVNGSGGGSPPPPPQQQQPQHPQPEKHEKSSEDGDVEKSQQQKVDSPQHGEPPLLEIGENYLVQRNDNQWCKEKIKCQPLNWSTI